MGTNMNAANYTFYVSRIVLNFFEVPAFEVEDLPLLQEKVVPRNF